MSGREWKPGDVAMVCNEFGVWNVAICAVSKWGNVWRFGVSDTWAGIGSNARPLVVIDPENSEQVERWCRIIEDAYRADVEDARPGYDVSVNQAALREFANPTPPKPDEPAGLGAVVEDDLGRHWVRLGRGVGDHWRNAGFDGGQSGHWHLYSDFHAVRVLSEGVQP